MDEVAQVKDRLDVAEVVGGYIELKQAGRNLKASCPFHQEKTASFMVSPEKNIWHCFGCGEGGDIFKFVMKIEGLDFRQALEILAKRAGVELKSKGDRGSSKFKQRLLEANHWAVRYFQANLIKNPKALQYLIRQRHLNKEAIKSFQVGYAPEVWEGLVKALKKQGFSEDELLKAGLAAQKRGIYDLFRGRIMLTICDSQGMPVGFTGRVLGEGEPKYLNTPQTQIYDKSRVIYGLHLAKEAIRLSDEVVLVEGNMDVIASHQAGVRQVVAVSGTALTLEQLKALSRLTKNIKLAFDQDQAGLTATIRAIELSQQLGLVLKMITLPEAKDPDELIKQDTKLWQKAIAEAEYVLDWLFEQLAADLDLSSELGKRSYSDRLAPVLNRLADPEEQNRYIRRLAKTTGASEEAVAKKVAAATTVIPVHARAIAVRPMVSPLQRDLATTIEEALLAIALVYPEARISLDDLNTDNFSSPDRMAIFTSLRKSKSKPTKIAKDLPDVSDYVKILTLKGEEEFSKLAPADLGFEAFNLARRLASLSHQKTKTELSQKLRQAEAAGDTKLAHRLLKEYQAIIEET